MSNSANDVLNMDSQFIYTIKISITLMAIIFLCKIIKFSPNKEFRDQNVVCSHEALGWLSLTKVFVEDKFDFNNVGCDRGLMIFASIP